MQNAVADRARVVSASQGQGKALRIVPIVGPSHDQPAYELLRDETFDRIRVREISDAGSVPVLCVENALEVRVLLIDGQELVGAKQNRILNTDVIVPAGSQLRIPVSCVEQGRWRPISAQFQKGKSSNATMRQAKAQRVHKALKEGRGHDADQAAVWNEVRYRVVRSGATSPTTALSDAYAARKRELDDFRTSAQMPADAVGLAAFHGDRYLGLDLFDRHSTLAYFWESLLDSYAIDFLDAAVDPAAPGGGAYAEVIRRSLDRAAQGAWDCFPSPGEGADWRLDDAEMSGGALIWEERVVVHLQLFPRLRDESRRPVLRRRLGDRWLNPPAPSAEK